MKAEEFFALHGVRAVAVPIAFYDREFSQPGGLTNRRMAWGLVLCRDEVGGNSQRILRLTHESGTTSQVGETFDWDDTMPGMVSEAAYGAMPFDEFISEAYDQCSDPVRAYDLWQGHVAWLRGDTKLREDFYSITAD